MSTDTDSPTSCSSTEDRKKRKSHKKHKSKSEKKAKKEKKEKRKSHKEKKKRQRDCSPPSEERIAPKNLVLPPDVANCSSTCESAEFFGPALPPHLQQKRIATDMETKDMIGPVMPSDYQGDTKQEKRHDAKEANEFDAADEEVDIYGPIPQCDSNQMVLSSTQIELEERALELKLATIEGHSLSNTADQNVREEWMLELPEVGLKGGLAALSNMKRTFHHGKDRPDFSDRSAWTKTPQTEAQSQNASSSKVTTSETLKTEAQAVFERQRDEEQERIAKKHKKKHKREESLVDIHQKKLRKEQRRREKELAASGAKPERRPFSRDVDLKLNKIDKNQTKQIVDKAKILNTKFATGHTKYL